MFHETESQETLKMQYTFRPPEVLALSPAAGRDGG
jgi:hypothetical protein